MLNNMETKSVLVAVTHTGQTVTGLESKLSKWIYETPFGAELHFSNINPTYSNRNTVVKYFLRQTKHTHLLFIDSDTVPFSNPVLMADLGLDVVGGVYPSWRVNHYEWLAMDKTPSGYVQIPAEKRKGIVECDGLGAGCLMMTREVLSSLPDPFADKVRADGTREVGHDYYFCERVKEKGFKVWANWDLLCDHIKQVPLLTIIDAMKRAFDDGYKQGTLDRSKPKG